jgi:ubiquinone/menaquinone biosynthesis C-methylase UbiE
MKNLYEESYFQTRFSDAAGRDHVWKVIAEYLSQFIPSNGTVLDLGAGYCSFINNVKAAHKVAVDVYPEFKLRASPDVATEVRSCTDLSCFSNNQFDVVFSSNLLEHLEFEDVQKTLREAKRILKETGRLILLQPNF